MRVVVTRDVPNFGYNFDSLLGFVKRGIVFVKLVPKTNTGV